MDKKQLAEAFLIATENEHLHFNGYLFKSHGGWIVDTAYTQFEGFCAGVKYQETLSQQAEVEAIEQQAQRIAELEAKYEACKQQAQCWKQEARTQGSIVKEIYQEITGKTGEPGDWNGAQPVRDALVHIKADAVEDALQSLVDTTAGGEADTDFPVRVYNHLKNYANNLRNNS